MSVSFHIGVLPGRPVSEVAQLVARAEELGFDGAWIADSQSIFRDGFAALTASALETERVTLAPGVTNPVTRHPAVLAGAMATLQETSGGRAVLGIGVGESSTATAGIKPAKLARMREVAEAVRALTRGDTVELDGAELHMPWASEEVPVYVASSGPRSLRMSGEYADGVLFQVGSAPAAVEYAMENVDLGLADAGRKRSDVKLYSRLASSIAEDREWARRQVHAYASVAAGTVFTSLPSEVVDDGVAEDIARMKEAYDYFEHGSKDAKHAELITDRIVDAISISGTAEEAVPRYRELVELGVEGFVIPVVSEDPDASMRALAEGVMPHFK
ncbi:MAG: LLM class flavin-dependent oxidoreductase [Solirubrobacterales bacterium]